MDVKKRHEVLLGVCNSQMKYITANTNLLNKVIYLVTLFSKSSTSENHTLGLGKDVHASGPVTQELGQDHLSLWVQDLFGQHIRPSLNKEGLAGGATH